MNYENGPEGMPRVKRMTDSTIDCVMREGFLGNCLRNEESYSELRQFAHNIAEEILARVPSWPALAATSSTEAPGPISTWEQRMQDMCGRTDSGLIAEQIACMKAEIADLRAALAQRPPEGNAKVGSIANDPEFMRLRNAYTMLLQFVPPPESLTNEIIVAWRAFVSYIDATIDAHSGKVEAEPIAEVSAMPGTTGFTIAVFKADEMPVGAKVYPAPHPPAQVVAEGLTMTDYLDRADYRLARALACRTFLRAKQFIDEARAIIATLKEPK